MSSFGICDKSIRTSEYFAELYRLCESIAIFTEDSYSPEKKRQELVRVCSIFYGGNIERIKAAVDIRITRYLHLLLQDPELRKYSLLIILQLSKALIADRDSNESLMSEQEFCQDITRDNSLITYIYGHSIVNNPAEIKRYIQFAKELPTIHFEQNKELFRMLGTAFESPVYSSVLVKLLKDPSELLENR